jgi:alpha-ketoglutarate-dependent taurine dioxygenase
MTPWHSTLVRGVDGSITMSHAIRVPALTHDLIYEGERPMYFREKSPLFSWPGMDLQFDYLYPTGMVIKPKDPTAKYSLHNVHMQKVRSLAEKCSPVILRGFTDTNDERTFIAKAYDAGEVLPWTFGVMQKVRDSGRQDRLANNVVSSEAMPMHYDGMFKFMNKKDPETGVESSVSCPPRFQYFTAKTPSPPGSGYTLFASSRLFFQHLPAKYSEEKLRKITWDCKNSGFWDNHMKNLPLIVSHPTTGAPCVRWHEPWPMWKTKFAHCVINIENGPQQYKQLVDQMLYDRRVCLYWTWEQGDVLVSDNFSMLHTRTAFEGDSDRELWRIHFD